MVSQKNYESLPREHSSKKPYVHKEKNCYSNSADKNFAGSRLRSLASDIIENNYSSCENKDSNKEESIRYDTLTNKRDKIIEKAQFHNNIDASKFRSLDSFINEQDTIITSNRYSHSYNAFKSKRSNYEKYNEQNYFSVDHPNTNNNLHSQYYSGKTQGTTNSVQS